ncbi:hypothetical protein L218DRAFT_993111 [Marasmius fiardii PR-910]|nr:hypothetical protein L218DRAFT_993111 [Marasmius fiardii PR-910]
MRVATSLATFAGKPQLASTGWSLDILAHPSGHHEISREELVKRQAAAQERHLKVRNCAVDIAAFHAKRQAKRALTKGNDSAPPSKSE